MTFLEAMDELGRLVAAPDTPPEVSDALLSLVEHPRKFVWLVKSVSPTAGALDDSPILQPSDLLVKLLGAARALDWPQVLALVRGCHEGFCPKNEGAR